MYKQQSIFGQSGYVRPSARINLSMHFVRSTAESQHLRHETEPDVWWTSMSVAVEQIYALYLAHRLIGMIQSRLVRLSKWLG